MKGGVGVTGKKIVKRGKGNDGSKKEFPVRDVTKGLPFMSLQFNVLFKRRQLAINKEVTPSEYYLLEEIEIGTIGARNSKYQICSIAEFDLNSLSYNLGYKEKDKIWKLVKSLHKKGLIIRKKTNIKTKEILGLNPKVFGQVLIDSYHQVEKKRHLKLVETPTQYLVENKEPTKHLGTTDESSPTNERFVGDEPTKRREISSQHIEIIEEKNALDSFRSSLDLFKMGSEEEIFNSLLEKFPNDRLRIQEAYSFLKREKKWNGKEIKNVQAWLLVSWKDIRDQFPERTYYKPEVIKDDECTPMPEELKSKMKTILKSIE